MPPPVAPQHQQRTFTRLILFIGAALVLYLLLKSSPTHPHNALGLIPTTTSSSTLHHRLVAVADLHGDYPHALNVLHMSGIINHDGQSPDQPVQWSGHRATLVSTGDIVDRGDDTIELYRMFQTLRSQATQIGGRVFNCLGNHEMMNAMGDWRYITRGDVDTFGDIQERRLAMSSHGWIGQEWLANYQVSHTLSLFPDQDVERLKSLDSNPLPDSYTSPRANFVHGGIHPDWADRGLDDITQIGHSLLNKSLTYQAENSQLARGRFPPDVESDEVAIWSENGPFWYRGYATEPSEQAACYTARKAAEALQVDYLVMGHTPHFDGFVHRCDPPLIHLIDTGISRAYGGEQSALVFDSDLHWDNEKWVETVSLIALYKARRPKVVHSTTRIVT